MKTTKRRMGKLAASVAIIAMTMALSSGVGCASQGVTRVSSPMATHSFTVAGSNGETFVCMPMPITYPKAGDVIAWRAKGRLVYGKILTVRGPGVFRVEGGEMNLVSSDNYIGQLFRTKAAS